MLKTAFDESSNFDPLIVEVESKRTPRFKTQCTKDWLTVFPEFGKYKPMWLMRRIGPIVMGICLDHMSIGAYRCRFHVFNLASNQDSIDMEPGQYLRTILTGAEDVIYYHQHEKVWLEAAQRFRTQITLPLGGPITFTVALEHYSGRRELKALSDRIAIASWCGHHDRAFLLLEDALEKIDRWPRHQMENLKRYRQFDLEAWSEEQSKIVGSQALAREMVNASITRFKLERVPVSELLCE